MRALVLLVALSSCAASCQKKAAADAPPPAESASAAAAPATPEQAAQRAAEAWLALVDAGRYGESWSQTAKLFQGRIDADGWTKALEGVRQPLGKVESRRVLSAQYRTSVPGAPDGEYVIVQFATSFAHKASAVETVTPAKESDGQWRVSGYFVK